MKIGIITFHYTANFGAALQAYALSRFLRKNGHDVCFVDYRPWRLKTSYLLWGERCWLHPFSMLQSRLRFCRFVKDHFNLTDKTYFTGASLHRNPPGLDAYICGSDRIWNWQPALSKKFAASYFLDFARADNAKLIAYAPSFSRLEVAPEHRDELVRLLGRFDAIAAREKSGKKNVDDLTDANVPIVADPTLLLEENDYTAALKKPVRSIPDEYIFLYNLESSKNFAQVVQRVSADTGLPVVAAGYPLIKGAVKAFNAGPGEWLWLMKNARYICTNSYHGVLLSIIFKKTFFAFPREYSNSRLETILDIAGLKDRFARDKNNIPSYETPPYESVYEKLGGFIRESRDFLRKALSKASG